MESLPMPLLVLLALSVGLIAGHALAVAKARSPATTLHVPSQQPLGPGDPEFSVRLRAI